MTVTEFQKSVVRSDLYGKYIWYVLSVAAVGAGIFGFYDIRANPEKYILWNTDTTAFYAFAFFILIGCCTLYLLPNRYKVLTIDNNYSIDEKKQIVSALLDQLNIKQTKNKESLYIFIYLRKCWASGYEVSLGIDEDKFYITVLLKTDVYRGVFIDLGGTERFRKKIVSAIKELINEKDNSQPAMDNRDLQPAL